MLISTEKKFIFVANSKAASTSIETALKPYALPLLQNTPAKKHLFLEQIIAKHSDIIASRPGGTGDFFKFGIMRDPVQWIKSWFRYRKGNKVAAPLPAETTFPEFWAMNDWNKWRNTGKKRLQSDFFLSHDGTLLADYIIPHDAIDTHFPLICKKLGVQATLDRVNVSKIRADIPLEPDLEAELRDFYAEDYTFLNRIGQINAAALPQTALQ